jgi:hypothetical protein
MAITVQFKHFILQQPEATKEQNKNLIMSHHQFSKFEKKKKEQILILINQHHFYQVRILHFLMNLNSHKRYAKKRDSQMLISFSLAISTTKQKKASKEKERNTLSATIPLSQPSPAPAASRLHLSHPLSLHQLQVIPFIENQIKPTELE